MISVMLFGAYVAALVWMRRMAARKPLPRFMIDYPSAGGPAMTTGLQLPQPERLAVLGVALLLWRGVSHERRIRGIAVHTAAADHGRARAPARSSSPRPPST
jgi:hypothetical protein